MRRAAVLPLMLCLAACASAPTAPAAPAYVPLSVATADYIWLEEGPCFGSCPVYRMTLYPEGQYVLMGERFTEGENRSDNKPSEDSFELAKAILTAFGFDEMEEDLTAGNPEACPNPATDFPTAMITIGDAEGYYRTVTYYQGCFLDLPENMLRQLRATMRIADLVQAAEPAE